MSNNCVCRECAIENIFFGVLILMIAMKTWMEMKFNVDFTIKMTIEQKGYNCVYSFFVK